MPGTKTIAAILYWALYFIAGNYGYSKPNRWTGLKGGKPTAPGDFDCTSIIGAILYLAGYLPLKLLQGTWYSGNIADELEKLGWRRVSAKGKSLAWLNANVLAGCVLVGPSHGVLGLGGGEILSWEYSETGKGSGKIGRQKGERVGKRKLYLRSKGWADLLIPPADAATVAQTTPLAFRAAIASQQAPYFGGKATGAQRGAKIRELGASVVALTETQIVPGVIGSAKAAALRAAIMAAIGHGWQRSAREAVCLMWDASKWSKVRSDSVTFGSRKGDVWHRALAVDLRRKDAQQTIRFVAVHVRPQTIASDRQKQADVKSAIALAGKGPAVILGDFAMNADALMKAAGYRRASLNVDSYDTKGVQLIDAAYLSPQLAGDAAKALDPGSISDHTWLSVHITKAPTTV